MKASYCMLAVYSNQVKCRTSNLLDNNLEDYWFDTVKVKDVNAALALTLFG